jgi:hypothetical protein
VHIQSNDIAILHRGLIVFRRNGGFVQFQPDTMTYETRLSSPAFSTAIL